MLHDDNEYAVDWLLSSLDPSIGIDVARLMMKDMLPQKVSWRTEIPVGNDGTENILSACALVLKYDCPSFMPCIADALTLSFKILQEKPAREWQYVGFVKKYIELVTGHNDGLYPVELANALDEAWFGLPNGTEECKSLVFAAIESQARLGLAVSEYYHGKLTRLAKTVENGRDILREPYSDK